MNMLFPQYIQIHIKNRFRSKLRSNKCSDNSKHIFFCKIHHCVMKMLNDSCALFYIITRYMYSDSDGNVGTNFTRLLKFFKLKKKLVSIR